MENLPKRRIDKPIGVYVSTFSTFFAFGILRFFDYLSEIMSANGNVSFTISVISLGLCLFTAGAAIWAFVGDNEGRIALLILLTLNFLWWILLAVDTLTTSESSEEKNVALSVIFGSIIQLGTIIGCWGFFMSKHVIEYYKRND
jgi:MFS family permease